MIGYKERKRRGILIGHRRRGGGADKTDQVVWRGYCGVWFSFPSGAEGPKD